jgi:hypothetical protein
MKKLGALTTILLIASSLLVVRVVDANFIGASIKLPTITILRDGSVVPHNGYITREGNVYKLTADLQQKYVIAINCSNIIFDGQEHLINGSLNFFWAQHWWGYNCHGIILEGQTNVTIKNVKVTAFGKPAIQVNNCSGISIRNVQCEEVIFSYTKNSAISASRTSVYLESSDNNLISTSRICASLDSSDNNLLCNNTILTSGETPFLFRWSEKNATLLYEDNISLRIYMSNNNFVQSNNISRIAVTWGSSNNLIYMNNISSVISASPTFWDNGSIGNYWSDYNGTDADGDGIGDTPYILNDLNQDNHPLMTPFEGSVITPPSPSISPTPETRPKPEAFPTTLVLGSVFTLAVAGIVLFVYFKKRKH